MKRVLNRDELQTLLLPLLDLPVSRPWRGYGSFVSLQLGELRQEPLGKTGKFGSFGEASVFIEWDWRIEDNSGIVCGTSDSIPKTETCVAALLGVRVTDLTVEGILPELTVSFSNGQRLRSMAMVSGDPQWHIKLLDSTYVCCEASRLVQTSGDEPGAGLSAEEQEMNFFAKTVTTRWGRPKAEPAPGDCFFCRNFIRLDADSSFLDYGVCSQVRSPYDGRVVNVKSGCSFFEGMSE
jgi:hypothetical protein